MPRHTPPARAMLDRRALLRALGAAGAAALAGPALGACDVREFARRHGAKLRLSIATGPVGGTYYVYGGAIAKVISEHIPNVEATAEVTSASVDNLKFLRDGRADLAFTTAPTLNDAYRGAGAFRSLGRVPVRAVAMLYVQPLHIVAAARRAATLADLRGRVVSTGPPGSGTEEIALSVLAAAGIDPASGIRRQRLGPAQAAEALRDGKLDAFFWSSAVPNAAVLDLTTSVGRQAVLLPSGDLLPVLQRAYGPALFVESTIPRSAYPGMQADVSTVGVASLLVADASLGEPLAHDVTRALFEHREELVTIHQAARELTLASAVVRSPVPFHPGAIRYYAEQRAWPG